MDEIKNNTEIEAVAENTPEEVIEVVNAEDGAEVNEDSGMEYTEAELSGLTEKQRRRNYIFDKITTGILILLLLSPIAILSYIFLWFIFR
jgi:hypothetical protein